MILKRQDEIEALLARKFQLTPSIVMATPKAPFPWRFVPYLHAILEPNKSYANGAITTDGIGLRRVEIGGKAIGFSEFQGLPGKKSLLIGASTAYSMGSSSDRTSIASRLSGMGDGAWFHLAVGSYVSTQESILYLLTNPKGIRHVVVLSGLNTLSAFLLDPYGSTDQVFPPNFLSGPSPTGGLRSQLSRHLRRRIAGAVRRGLRKELAVSMEDDRVRAALAVTRKNLELLRDLCASRGARLWFIAQPLLAALRKPLSPEEREITEIQRTLGRYEEFALWGLFLDEIPRIYPDYCRALKRECQDLGVGFLDMNGERSLLNREGWLFSDQAHFTDDGCRVCAEQIHALVEG